MDNLSPEQIKQMINMLQSMLSATDTKSSEEQTEYKPIIKNKPSKKIKADRHNKFEDMMEHNLHKDDIAIDKALSVHAPTPRVRRYEPVSATCRVCGKKDSINPALISDTIDRYKCNKCARNAG